MTTMQHPPADRRHLLSSVQMAHFVANGSIRLDGVVPDEINAEGIDVLRAGIPIEYLGTSIADTYAAGSFVRRLLELPPVAGAIRSLVGPDPTVDHHAVHVRPPHGGQEQPLHGDAIIDVRTDAFDVQLMYYPQRVTLDMGGTLTVPGSHLRRTNESDTARYQNLRGQVRLTCPAGTVVFLHHGVWHRGRANHSDVERYMLKIRLNPTVRQLRLWNTDDLDDPEVGEQLNTHFPWYEDATGRLEILNRVKLWRTLTGDDTFDVDLWATRIANRPARLAAEVGAR